MTVNANSGSAFTKGSAYVTADISGCAPTLCADENNNATISIKS